MLAAKKTKEDMQHTIVLFPGSIKLPNLAFCISKTTKPIDHLHVRTKEFINMLIAVMSRLDAAVTSINVLNPMENQCCGMFKCMLCFKYMAHVNFTNNAVTAIKSHTLLS